MLSHTSGRIGRSLGEALVVPTCSTGIKEVAGTDGLLETPRLPTVAVCSGYLKPVLEGTVLIQGSSTLRRTVESPYMTDKTNFRYATDEIAEARLYPL